MSCEVVISAPSWVHSHNAPRAPCRKPTISVSSEMKSRILRYGWLQDEELLLCMNFLRLQFPDIGGLLHPGMLESVVLPEPATQCNNIYIVHCGGNHWVCAQITCAEPVFKVYDSLAGNDVPCDVQEKLKKVAQFKTSFSLQKTQTQHGPEDCGVFAIAFAVSLAFGECPSDRYYLQSSLRSHLLHCLKKRIMTPFPSIKD
jgi:hypothetical protein